MDLENILVDNSILVIPNNIKNKVLLEINKTKELYNVKIMDINELITRLTFSYDESAIYYLMKKYNIKYEVSKVYLDNIKYVKEKSYNNEKLDKLCEIKMELISKNLLKYDKYFLNFINDKNVIVYGYDYINNYQKSILANIKNVKIIDKKIKNYKHDIYEFNMIDDEVMFVCERIIDFINSGIDINNIKLIVESSEYDNVIDRIFKLYNIPVNSKNKNIIYDTSIISSFIKLIKDNNIEKTLEIIKDTYNLENENNIYIYNKLIDILNKYTFISDYNEVLDMLIYDFKHTNNYKKQKSNSIEIINLKDNIISDNEYVFLLGFNQGNYPVIHKDEDYINDSLKGYFSIESTKQLNNIEKKNLINTIKSIKNLIITYKLKTPFDTYQKSSIIEDLDFNIITDTKLSNNYSDKINYIKLSEKLDNMIKYGEKDDDLNILYNNYSDIKYLTFDNKFKGINKDSLISYLDNKLLLSYTSVDNYYRCSFRYYLSNILKLNPFEETFAIKIGNIFHYVLSKCFNEDFDFEQEFNKSYDDNLLDLKDRFFLKKLKKELMFVIDTIKNQNKFSSLDKALYENKVYINKDGNVKLTFMGIIDKLLYKEENENTYLVIIDYKTGNPHTNLNNTIYGIDMQLPVYLYLSNNIKEIKNPKVIGFYLQKILNNEISKVKGKSYEKIKKDNLKLQGYSINDEEMLKKFDFTCSDSEVISSMKIGKNGFYSYSKTISCDEINKLIQLTKKNIDMAFNNILSAKFAINPKRIGKENIGCKFCKYKDICYVKEEDIVNLKEYENLEFLK